MTQTNPYSSTGQMGVETDEERRKRLEAEQQSTMGVQPTTTQLQVGDQRNGFTVTGIGQDSETQNNTDDGVAPVGYGHPGATAPTPTSPTIAPKGDQLPTFTPGNEGALDPGVKGLGAMGVEPGDKTGGLLNEGVTTTSAEKIAADNLRFHAEQLVNNPEGYSQAQLQLLFAQNPGLAEAFKAAGGDSNRFGQTDDLSDDQRWIATRFGGNAGQAQLWWDEFVSRLQSGHQPTDEELAGLPPDRLASIQGYLDAGDRFTAGDEIFARDDGDDGSPYDDDGRMGYDGPDHDAIMARRS